MHTLRPSEGMLRNPRLSQRQPLRGYEARMMYIGASCVLEAGGVGDMCMYHDVLESDVQSAAQDPHAYAALLRGEKSSIP